MAKRRFPPRTPDDLWPFTKHKGDPIWQVIEDDPDYVNWCLENIDGFELDNEAFELLKKASEK